MTARLVLAACALAVAGLSVGGGDPHGLTLTAAHGVARIESSRAGSAVIEAGNLQPGDVVHGTVTLANRSDAAAPIRLTSAPPVDRARPGGARLGDVLRVAIADDGGAGRPLAEGTLAEIAGCHPLAALPARGRRTYRFTARLPRAAGNAYAGSSVSADATWQAGGCDAKVAAAPRRPRLRISHRRVALQRGRARLRLRCLGPARCAGTLSLVPSAAPSRLATAARTAFSIPGGRTRTVLAAIPRASLRALQIRGKAVAAVAFRGRDISQRRTITLIATASR
jgi:hypothetical protein